MGNREDLLRGAKGCIVELGYARTTARDISDAAGTSLAAIGYHFGSKQNLVTTAMTEMLTERLDPTPVASLVTAAPQDAPISEQFESTWSRLIEQIAGDPVGIAVVMENLAQLGRLPEVQETLSEQRMHAISKIGRAFAERNPDLPHARADAVAKFYAAVLLGLVVAVAIDEESVPTAAEMLLAMETLQAS